MKNHGIPVIIILVIPRVSSQKECGYAGFSFSSSLNYLIVSMIITATRIKSIKDEPIVRR
jgi:hypothetical protein